MSIHVTYPGVYVQEVPSGVHTITGVATSITAFIGRAKRGPVNDPVAVNNFADYERTFGGLDTARPMSYAVYQYFLNGGGQALVVRLYKQPTGNNITATATLALSTNVTLKAASQGAWGGKLRARVDRDGITQEIADQLGVSKIDDLINLTVEDTATKKVERFTNLTLSDTPRCIDRVLAHQSTLVRADKPGTDAVIEIKTDDDGENGNGNGNGNGGNGGENNNGNGAGSTGSTPSAPATPQWITATGGADSAEMDVTSFTGDQNDKTGLYALEHADLFNLLCIPPDTRDGDLPDGVLSAALAYCVARRAVLIVDPPSTWTTAASAKNVSKSQSAGGVGLTGPNARNAALYFPRIKAVDPQRGGQVDTFVPCGAVAGVIARTDAARGVWKAPAGLDAALTGIEGYSVPLTDAENGALNPLGVNCLRTFPAGGPVIWGARTLRGADQLADEYKYLPVRRLALFIEESLYRGTQWAVFEPNDEPLWSQLRLNIGVFMHDLFRKGAFQGSKPRDAYFVRCDSTTTTQSDINQGIVTIVVGFAPLRPAEFVVISLQQMAGSLQT